MKKIPFGLLFLALLALAWEWPILRSPFNTVSDDPKFLRVMHPLQLVDIPSYLGTNWGWVYRPVYLLYFAGMLRLAGPHPLPFHAFSVAVHLLNCSLLGWLCWRLLETPDEKRRRLFSLACGGAWFFWQGHTETIFAASCTSTLLCALFMLLSLHAFLSWRTSNNRLAALGCLAAFALGMGSKEEAVMVPALCCVLDVWFLPRLPKSSRWIYGSMAVILGAFAWASLASQSAISLAHPKIVTVPRAINPLAVVDFYLMSLGVVPWAGRAFATPFMALDVAVLFALVSLVYRRFEPSIRGAFWLSFLVCVPVPLMTGIYALHAEFERFHYLPWAFIFLLAAAYFNDSVWRLPKSSLVLAAAAIGGIARELVTNRLLRNPYDHASDDLNFLINDNTFVPCVVLTVVLLSLFLWKWGILDVAEVAAVVATAVFTQLCSMSSGWLFIVLPAASLLVIAIAFERSRAGTWGAGILVGAALWEMPSLTLPLFLLLVVAAKLVSAKVPAFTRSLRNERELLFRAT